MGQMIPVRNYRKTLSLKTLLVPPVSNIIAFYTAAAGVSQASNNVSAWADSSAFGNAALLNTSGTGSPQYGASSFNSAYPGITFNAANLQRLQATNFNGLNSTTVSIFALVIGTASAQGALVTLKAGADDFTTPSFLSIYNGSGSPNIQAYSSGWLGNGGSAVAVTNGVPLLHGLIFDGANANIYKDMVAQGAGTAFTAALGVAGASNDLAIGGRPTQGNFLDGVAAYVLMTSGAMSAADRATLKSWTNANWGTAF